MKIKRLVQYAIYLSILTFMAWVPQVGFIYFSGIRFTTMLIPIIICSVHLGFNGAIFTSTIFGFWSFITGMTINPSIIFAVEGIGLWFLNSVITRFFMGICIGLTVVLLMKNKKRDKRQIFITLLFAAIVGQLSNMILFLGTYIIFMNKSFDIIIGLITINLLIEWIIVIMIPLSFTHLVCHLRNQNMEVERW